MSRRSFIDPHSDPQEGRTYAEDHAHSPDSESVEDNTKDPARSGLDIMKTTEARRLDHLAMVGAARNSAVITYFTSTREMGFSSIYDNDVRVLERHIAQAHAAGVENIDLVLCTWGGDAVMPWNFHAMFRDYFPKGKLGVFAPFECYSAGTSIALGADEIVMGRSSVLGPTDTQMVRGDFESWMSVSDLTGFMALLREFDGKRKIDDATALSWLSANSDPMSLGAVYRVWQENRNRIVGALNSRRKPLSAKENEKIADFFLYEVGIHSQAIRRREALAAGLSFITLMEETPCNDDIARLFSLYADIMKLFSPYAISTDQAMRRRQFGDENDFDIYGVYAAHTPVVIVESQFETNAAFRAYSSSRHWDTPPPMSPASRPGGDDYDHDYGGQADRRRQRADYSSSRRHYGNVSGADSVVWSSQTRGQQRGDGTR